MALAGSFRCVIIDSSERRGIHLLIRGLMGGEGHNLQSLVQCAKHVARMGKPASNDQRCKMIVRLMMVRPRRRRLLRSTSNRKEATATSWLPKGVWIEMPKQSSAFRTGTMLLKIMYVSNRVKSLHHYLRPDPLCDHKTVLSNSANFESSVKSRLWMMKLASMWNKE